MRIEFRFNKKKLAHECHVTTEEGKYIIHTRELQKIIRNQIVYERQKRTGDQPTYMIPSVGFMPKAK